MSDNRLGPGRRKADVEGLVRRVSWRDFQGLRVLLWATMGVCVAFAIGTAITTVLLVDRINNGREIGILDACHNDNAQDNVLRELIIVSLGEQERRGASRSALQRNRRLAEQLLAPLGGLDPEPRYLVFRCSERVGRATP
jgi:hypothetical protein